MADFGDIPDMRAGCDTKIAGQSVLPPRASAGFRATPLRPTCRCAAEPTRAFQRWPDESDCPRQAEFLRLIRQRRRAQGAKTARRPGGNHGPASEALPALLAPGTTVWWDCLYDRLPFDMSRIGWLMIANKGFVGLRHVGSRMESVAASHTASGVQHDGTAS